MCLLIFVVNFDYPYIFEPIKITKSFHYIYICNKISWVMVIYDHYTKTQNLRLYLWFVFIIVCPTYDYMVTWSIKMHHVYLTFDLVAKCWNCEPNTKLNFFLKSLLWKSKNVLLDCCWACFQSSIVNIYLCLICIPIMST
jgi:hypothetical protein